MVTRMGCIACAALVGFSPAYAHDCLPPPSTITGQLRIVESRHPDGTPIRAFVVFVEEGPCVSLEDVDGTPADIALRDVHLAPKDGQTPRWSEAVGSEVTVQGRMGVPFTRWHIGSSMMFDATLSAVHAPSDE